MNELPIPHPAFDATDAQEFVRFWIAGGREHVSLHVGAMGDLEVQQWGMMLADISMHIIRALQQDGSRLSEKELREKLEKAYAKRLKVKGIEHTGRIGGTRH